MRYCCDCEHFMLDAKNPERGPICMRFKRDFMVSEHPVTGARWSYSAPDCEVARAEGGQCGPQGRFWAPRFGTNAYAAAKKEEKEMEVQASAPAWVAPWWKFWA